MVLLLCVWERALILYFRRVVENSCRTRRGEWPPSNLNLTKETVTNQTSASALHCTRTVLSGIRINKHELYVGCWIINAIMIPSDHSRPQTPDPEVEIFSLSLSSTRHKPSSIRDQTCRNPPTAARRQQSSYHGNYEERRSLSLGIILILARGTAAIGY